MKEQLNAIALEAKAAVEAASSNADLEALRVKYLGKKGEVTAILKQMGKLSAEERPVVGQLANEVRQAIEAQLEEKVSQIKAAELQARLVSETLDVTMPGEKVALGHKHPLSIVLDEVKEIFLGMGFEVATGPEVEWDYYNFEALNIPKEHPARDRKTNSGKTSPLSAFAKRLFFRSFSVMEAVRNYLKKILSFFCVILHVLRVIVCYT